MGGSYKQCTECGKRALSIATRCPGCGWEFPAPAVPERAPAPGLGGFLSPRVAGGLLAVAAVLALAELGQTSRPPAQAPAPVADSSGAFSEVAYARAHAEPAESELLVARTWASVRGGRSKGAELEAVLMPGDTVLADSLMGGWYRVALDGEVLGYAHRSTLAALGAPTEEPVERQGRQGS